MLRIRKVRYSPGFRKCDGCREIHLNAAFSEIIQEGKTKGRIRCAMCTAIEATQHGFVRAPSPDPTPAESASLAQPLAPHQEQLEL